ncbi:hypothetical protein F2P81_004189 [Scophthalmus maximus]|uniref:Uncharacterized protein n=1 Tax=Scophthalmus maximus TaxID=52904 RepID=A0A6A4TLI1_SCOMX|nr:hypothetical protein F2P81_004189 [Scophthalmus maximus]
MTKMISALAVDRSDRSASGGQYLVFQQQVVKQELGEKYIHVYSFARAAAAQLLSCFVCRLHLAAAVTHSRSNLQLLKAKLSLHTNGRHVTRGLRCGAFVTLSRKSVISLSSQKRLR